MRHWIAWFAVTVIVVGMIVVFVGIREWQLWRKEKRT